MSFDPFRWRTIGSTDPEFLRDPEKDEVVGRTVADLLYDSRFYILVIVLVVFVGLAYVFFPGIGEWFSANMEILRLFFGPMILFFIVGLKLVPMFLRVPTMDFLVLDFEGFGGAIYRIPVTLLAKMQISGGNSLSFSWRTGDTFRLARSVDLENRIIDLAWPHEVPIEQAAFSLSDMQRREKDYEQKSKENLLLRRRPVIIGTDLARTANDYLVSELSDLLKMKGFDIKDYIEVEDPLSKASEVDSEEDDVLGE